MEDNSVLVMSVLDKETTKPTCKLSFPHVLVATLVSFLFCHHLGVLNEPLESISMDLGFVGNSMAEGLVVSICLTGAFVGSLFSGRIADEVGWPTKERSCCVSSTISVTSGSHSRFRLPSPFPICNYLTLTPSWSSVRKNTKLRHVCNVIIYLDPECSSIRNLQVATPQTQDKPLLLDSRNRN